MSGHEPIEVPDHLIEAAADGYLDGTCSVEGCERLGVWLCECGDCTGKVWCHRHLTSPAWARRRVR